MTEKEYHRDEHEKCFLYYGTRCRCGQVATQCAHLIPQRKGNLAKYGWLIIHSRYNMRPVCSLKCNNERQVGMVEYEKTYNEIMEEIYLDIVKKIYKDRN